MIEIKYEAENVLSALERLQLAAVNTSPIMAQIAGVMHDAVEEFQSSPAPKDGRYYKTYHRHTSPYWVSILARPEGRALHTLPDVPYSKRLKVSILARPEGRALHVSICFR